MMEKYRKNKKVFVFSVFFDIAAYHKIAPYIFIIAFYIDKVNINIKIYTAVMTGRKTSTFFNFRR